MDRTVVVKAVLTHNHSLATSIAEALPFEQHHHIPPEFEQFAEDMQGFRLPFDIHQTLLRLASKRGLPVTWTERDIRNRYPMPAGAGMWQTEGLLQRLLQDGRQHDVRIGSNGTVDALVWLMDDGDDAVLIEAQNVSIFDNTFNTNSLGYKLGIFSTVDRNGYTRLAGCTLMLRETRDNFKWVLATFVRLIGGLLVVLLTDGDLWLAEAIQAVGNITHLLCTWHLSRNLLRNVRPAFGNIQGGSGWAQFLRKWWIICLKGDTSSVSTFDAEWEALKAYLIEEVTDPESYSCQKALAYLGGPDVDDDYESLAAFSPSSFSGDWSSDLLHQPVIQT